MLFLLALIVLLSVCSNWVLWQMLKDPVRVPPRAPAVFASVPDTSLDWRGLV
jgi:hypothetical protein